ncbi:MAG: hypothetical protein VKJ46_14165 [Leptolyngbyaceae bacterium]|nr:hypothetical protein [Leptolyngbyaceae bacterium]
MKLTLIRGITLPVGLTALTLMGQGLPAQAQPNPAAEPISNSVELSPKTAAPSIPWQVSEVTDPQLLEPTSKAQRMGESSRSAADLTDKPANAAPGESSGVAQFEAQPVEPAVPALEPSPTRTSYIGVGGNIGISGGSSDVSRGGFTVLSKIGLTNDLSVRPSVVFAEDAAIMVPLTYDFAGLEEATGVPIAPYIGGGVAISTGNNSEVGPLLSGGIDVPITTNLTATAALNTSFFDTTDLGVFIGVGYNFPTTGF